MQIQTLEDMTGLDRATIRFYERQGLISPNRLQNGYRDYTDAHYVDLMRIKLLRQTGLPLETIKQLMDGRVTLGDVLSDQLDVIDKYEKGLDQARLFCKMMLQDNVTYHSIDPFRYLNAKEMVEIESPCVIDTTSEEVRYTQSHPFRRYIARRLDQLFVSALVMLIVIVFMHVRPYTSMYDTLISMLSILACMPINALCLWMFGTTPGKFATGISVRDINDKNLTFLAAIKREWDVLRYGYGFFIPIYTWIRQYKSYKTHTAGEELSWDYYSDVQYKPWSRKRMVSIVLLTILSISIIFFCAFNLQYPKFRTDHLTMEQFSHNYNDYALQNEMNTYISPEGEWYTKDTPGAVIIETDPSVENWSFVTDQAGNLERIEFELLTDSRFFFLDQRKISLALFTAVMSKPDAKSANANAAVNDLSDIEIEISKDVCEGEFNHCDVVVKWECGRIENTKSRFRLLIHISL